MITDDEDYLSVQLYGINELPKGFRKSFRPPSDPYDKDARSIEYLRDNGIVFYRDSDHSEAVIVLPNDGGPHIFERRGWQAYHSHCRVDRETLEVGRWDEPERESERLALQKKINKEGDDRAWLEFNKLVVVTSMNEARVSLA